MTLKASHKLIATFIGGFALSACVSAAFGYKFYYADLVSYDGKLLASRPQDDLDASVCKPTQTDHPCVVMLKTEFKALYLDYLDTQQKLIDCQKP